MKLSTIRKLGCALAAVGLVGSSGCKNTNFIGTKEEVRLGRDAAEEIARRHRVVTGTPEARRVAEIGARIIEHNDKRPGVPYSFKVLDLKEINAVSLPGGPVFVYRGLLDLLGRDDDALACVIGHEVGHIDARHSAKQMSQQLAANIGILVLLKGRSAQDIGSLTTSLINLSYSRSDEYEADHRGLSYAHRAGYKATGLLTFFQKLRKLEKDREQGVEILRTHPLTTARMDRARKIIEKQDYRFGR